MLYINDPKSPYKTYDEVVDFAIKNGIEPKRVYIYLAALGVKGTLTRVLSSDGMSYLPAFKVAITNRKMVSKMSVCSKCKGLSIE